MVPTVLCKRVTLIGSGDPRVSPIWVTVGPRLMGLSFLSNEPGPSPCSQRIAVRLTLR